MLKGVRLELFHQTSSLHSLLISSLPLFPLSIEEPMTLGTEDDREERPALVPSLFPFMPPTLYFSTANEKGQETNLLHKTQ